MLGEPPMGMLGSPDTALADSAGEWEVRGVLREYSDLSSQERQSAEGVAWRIHLLRVLAGSLDTEVVAGDGRVALVVREGVVGSDVVATAAAPVVVEEVQDQAHPVPAGQS